MSTGPDSPQPPPDPQQQAGPPPGYGQPQPGPPPGYGQPPQQPGPPAGYPVPAPLRPDEEKMWAIGAHLGPLILGFIAPLVVWLVYKDRSPFLNRTAKEALNFQLTVLVAYLISFVLMLLLIGFLLVFVVWVASIVLMIIATIAVSRFEDYRYPLTIRFIS